MKDYDIKTHHIDLPCLTSYFLRVSNLCWSAFFNKPRGSQKPRGGWTPISPLKSIFNAEEVGLALLGAKAEVVPNRNASNSKYLNIVVCLLLLYAPRSMHGWMWLMIDAMMYLIRALYCYALGTWGFLQPKLEIIGSSNNKIESIFMKRRKYTTY